MAHLIAGWVAKVPELDANLALAAGLEGHLARAVMPIWPAVLTRCSALGCWQQ